MQRCRLMFGVGVSLVGLIGSARADGPYRVVKTAKVGGGGGFDYVFADSDGRRLYIARGATKDGPAARGSDGAVFNPKTMEAFSSAGNGTLTVIKREEPGLLLKSRKPSRQCQARRR